LQEQRLAELDRVQGWRSTVFANGQPTLKGAPRQFPSGAFPYRKIASARIFGFGYVKALWNECGYRSEGEPVAAPAEALPFGPDGSLCPDVIAPPQVLSADDLKRILGAMRAAEAAFGKNSGVISLRCGFDPHHAIVFYDERDLPIAKLLVCLTCGEVLAVPAIPALGGKSPASLDDGLWRALRPAFEQAELGVWMYDEKELARVLQYRERVLGPSGQRTPRGAAVDSLGSGLEPSRPVTQLASDERARLCLWFQEAAWSRHDPDDPYRFPGPGRGYECDDGRKLMLDATPRCAPAPAACNASVGEVEACLRELLHLEIRSLCKEPEPAVCQKMHGCILGARFE
jgi:hypothetical protein